MHDLRIPTRKAAAAILLASALPGCAASSLALAPDAPDVPFKTETASGHEQPTQLGVAPGPRDFGLPADANLPLASTSPPIDSTHTYSLAELIDLAQTLNPETRVAWERARQAALGVGIVKALYLPALSAIAVGGGQRDTGSTQAGSLPALSDNGGLHGTVSSLALQWLIFDFGQRDALSQAASQISLASNIAFNGTHQKIIFDVSRAFYEYTSARQRVAIALQSKADSAHVRDAASDRYKQGIGTSVETAQANQLFAQADFDVVQAQGAERDAYHGLLAAVGVSPTVVIRIEDVSRRQLQTVVRTFESKIGLAVGLCLTK
jgi:outer membrane protein